MRKKIEVLIFLLNMCYCNAYCEQCSSIKFSLSESEKNALDYSQRLKASELDRDAAYKKMLGQKAALYPKLSVDGSYRYQTSVTELDLSKLGLGVKKLGDNENYSIGPAISWTIFDFNGLKNSYSSARSYAESKKYEAEGVRRQVLLELRKAYFELAYSAEQVVLLSDALKLSNEQYDDIKLNYRAGTKSKMDMLSSHQELLTREKQLNKARLGMASAFRDISSLTGIPFDEKICNPLDIRVNGNYDFIESTPTVYIEVDPIDTLSERFKPYLKANVWESHPKLEVFDELAKSAEFSAKSAASGYWPKFQVSARSSIEYPNGPKLEPYNQNTYGASVSWTLFESGAANDRVKENQKIKEAYLQKKDAQYSEFKREWVKTMDTLSSLEEQYSLGVISSREADELAQIAYKSYTTGSLTYLELQNANFRALESKIELAKIKVEMLINMAILASLAK